MQAVWKRFGTTGKPIISGLEAVLAGVTNDKAFALILLEVF